jgi:hypothetical protein
MENFLVINKTKLFFSNIFIDSSKNERITNSINQLKTYCVKATPATQFKKFNVPWVKKKERF